jgi:hypothetical protein
VSSSHTGSHGIRLDSSIISIEEPDSDSPESESDSSMFPSSIVVVAITDTSSPQPNMKKRGGMQSRAGITQQEMFRVFSVEGFILVLLNLTMMLLIDFVP